MSESWRDVWLALQGRSGVRYSSESRIITAEMEVTMSVPMLTKMHMNGYDVLSVNNGPWRVCTKGDRLGAFGSREEALAFAAALPGYKAKASRPARSQKSDK
ncbi:hypothetical protein V466_15580 [Pseudomonas mandelii PD30]|uniref:DUF2188 domain-containing protein n=2 Tax=Pseudomonas fluorescens group TaxID=136843 RepID=A0A059L1U4_9PSED|nr:hypothetical protein V466_15580 [Pseudomonas mandelii PD30]